MPRSITDGEIGLIKAMLRQGVRNRDIQFFFNRPDRPVNSGRITQIRKGTYGPEVPEADAEALQRFREQFKPAGVGVRIENNAAINLIIADSARARFTKHQDGKWYLANGETTDQECKREFDPKRIEPVIRAIAALANNVGGYIFFGVRDDDFQAIGMPDTKFQDTDIVQITDKLTKFLTPTPSFKKDIINLDGILVGVLYVEKYPIPPVIVCRDGHEINEGTILFRTNGKSGNIKFGDLLTMLRERDRLATKDLLLLASRLNDIGTDRALIIDTNKGELAAGKKQFQIDRALAEQLNFIREGEFVERQGAPALRLMGHVQILDPEGQVINRIEEKALDANSALIAYLRHEAVAAPLEYICLSAKVQRQWLPIFYFVTLADGDVEAAIKALDATQAVYKNSKSSALNRLRHKLSAFKEPKGTPRKVVEDILAGEIDQIREKFSELQIMTGLRGLPDHYVPNDNIFNLVENIYADSEGDRNVQSAIFSAVARLDELEFQNNS